MNQILGSYARRNPNAAPERRTGESEEGYRRRIQPWLKAAEYAQHEAEIEEAATAMRANAGHGLDGAVQPGERAGLYAGTGYGSRGMGSGREIEHLGGLVINSTPGQIGLRRVYRSQLQEPVSAPVPDTATLRSSSTDWL